MADERTNKILNRLPHWWEKSDASVTTGIILSFVSEFDEVAAEIDNLHLEVFVDTATGVRLDELARIYKLLRNPGELDDVFRERIKAFLPGFTGGGTIQTIKSTINKVSGIPEDDVTIDEFGDMKIRVEVVIDSPEDMALIPTIKAAVWDIRAAGVYPFFEWTLSGALMAEFVDMVDAVIAPPVPTLNWFIWEASLIDGGALIW